MNKRDPLARFVGAARDWDAAMRAPGKNAKRANRIFRSRLAPALREILEQGGAEVEGLLSLMDDEHPAVAMYAACAGLRLQPERARAVLGRLKSQRSLHIGVTSEAVLDDFHSGTIRFAWENQDS